MPQEAQHNNIALSEVVISSAVLILELIKTIAALSKKFLKFEIGFRAAREIF